ncbi:MAG: prephenate dehydrogenase/arogenate dehydrogenase family protein [Bacteroidota bacterium]
MTVGIIGYGRFGKLSAKLIARRANVLVYDKNLRPKQFPSRRIRNATLQKASSQSIVILAVPVSSLQQALRSIVPYLQPSPLVLDVCAVKVKPVEWMKTILPKDVSILGTHPLFGPDSAHASIKGHRVFICPVRIQRELLRHVIRQLKAAGLVVNTISPEEHDKMIAETLFLTQYIGRLVGKAGLRRHAFSTKSYTDLMKIIKIADNDTRELFQDMLLYNPHAKQVLKRLLRAETNVLNELY